VAEDPAETVVRWRTLTKIGGFDLWQPLRIDRNEQRLYAHSNLGRDKSALVEIDLAWARSTCCSNNRVWTQAGRSSHAARSAVWCYDDSGLSSDRLSRQRCGKGNEGGRRSGGCACPGQGVLSQDPVLASPGTVSEDAQRLVVKSLSAFASANCCSIAGPQR